MYFEFGKYQTSFAELRWVHCPTTEIEQRLLTDF